MEKLKEIEISNFESHENTKIELHPGVNVLIGRSDVGKSAIMRALTWVLTNKPSGDSYVSDWDNSNTSVKLTFEDGAITRIRKDNFNGYILNKQKFKGFGQSVPDEILKFLNVNLTNLQTSQFDRPFLLDMTAGERGVFLNKITDLEITDRAISNIKSTLLKENYQIKALSFDIEKLENEAQKYLFIEKMEEDIDKLESIIKKQKDKDWELEKISELTAAAEDAEEVIKSLDHIKDLSSKVKAIQTKIEKLKQYKNKYDAINKLVKRILYIETIQEELKDVADIKRSIEKIYTRISEAISLEEKAKKLIHICSSISRLNKSHETLKQNIRSNRSTFNSLMPDTCPLCGK